MVAAEATGGPSYLYVSPLELRGLTLLLLLLLLQIAAAAAVRATGSERRGILSAAGVRGEGPCFKVNPKP